QPSTALPPHLADHLLQLPPPLPAPPSPQVRTSLGSLGVVAGRFEPEIVAEVTGSLVGAAALRGAVIPVMFPLAIFTLPITATISIADTAGAALAAREVKKTARGVPADMAPSRRFGERLASLSTVEARRPAVLLDDRGPAAAGERPTYRDLASSGVQTVVEAVIERVELRGDWLKTEGFLALAVTARVRLVRVSDAAELHRFRLVHLGPKLPVRAWNQGAVLSDAVTAAIDELARAAIDEMFLLYQPVTSPARDSDLVGLRRLGPDDQAASTTPTLEWESFPRPADLTADPRLAAARNVTYELRLWRAPRSPRGEYEPASGPAAYARTGLPGTRHRIETSLAPSEVYLWTLRARFELDGWPQVTEWSMLAPARDPVQVEALLRSPVVPRPGNYFLFQTPALPSPDRGAEAS
ncbi:MAG TPA: hypothetical protein VGB87_19170, partial [Vicinamibacteria bacterium]